MAFHLNQTYTRQQIHDALGGDLQSYLPHVSGAVVCGCFDPELNAPAPFEIDIGDLPNVLKYADRLAQQADPVPVFIKRANFGWEFVGRFRATALTRDLLDLHPAKSFRRPDAVAVLYLTEEDVEVDTPLAGTEPPIEQLEGQRAMFLHFRRERSPVLTEAKRRAFRAEHGALRCEACLLSESTLPRDIGDACFEVHHLLALGERPRASPTRIDDLVVVCANCHRMIHRSSPMLAVESLARVLRRDA